MSLFKNCIELYIPRKLNLETPNILPLGVSTMLSYNYHAQNTLRVQICMLCGVRYIKTREILPVLMLVLMNVLAMSGLRTL